MQSICNNNCTNTLLSCWLLGLWKPLLLNWNVLKPNVGISVVYPILIWCLICTDYSNRFGQSCIHCSDRKPRDWILYNQAFKDLTCKQLPAYKNPSLVQSLTSLLLPHSQYFFFQTLPLIFLQKEWLFDFSYAHTCNSHSGLCHYILFRKCSICSSYKYIEIKNSLKI